ncbi:MAG: protein kinase [Candidatus Omnitrophica bacterium]|nr:protein kinase [Candidatus Omnitrophota bacterium]
MLVKNWRVRTIVSWLAIILATSQTAYAGSFAGVLESRKKQGPSLAVLRERSQAAALLGARLAGGRGAKIGEGGMSTVYGYTDPVSGKALALLVPKAAASLVQVIERVKGGERTQKVFEKLNYELWKLGMFLAQEEILKEINPNGGKGFPVVKGVYPEGLLDTLLFLLEDLEADPYLTGENLKRRVEKLGDFLRQKPPVLLEERFSSDYADTLEEVVGSPSWRDSARWSLMDKLLLLRGIAEGIEYLHGQGIIHGDIKPDNIHISSKIAQENPPKIIDFSLAHRIGSKTYEVLARAGKKNKITMGTNGFLILSRSEDAYHFNRDVSAFGMLALFVLDEDAFDQVQERVDFSEEGEKRQTVILADRELSRGEMLGIRQGQIDWAIRNSTVLSEGLKAVLKRMIRVIPLPPGGEVPRMKEVMEVLEQEIKQLEPAALRRISLGRKEARLVGGTKIEVYLRGGKSALSRLWRGFLGKGMKWIGSDGKLLEKVVLPLGSDYRFSLEVSVQEKSRSQGRLVVQSLLKRRPFKFRSPRGFERKFDVLEVELEGKVVTEIREFFEQKARRQDGRFKVEREGVAKQGARFARVGGLGALGNARIVLELPGEVEVLKKIAAYGVGGEFHFYFRGVGENGVVRVGNKGEDRKVEVVQNDGKGVSVRFGRRELEEVRRKREKQLAEKRIERVVWRGSKVEGVWGREGRLRDGVKSFVGNVPARLWDPERRVVHVINVWDLVDKKPEGYLALIGRKVEALRKKDPLVKFVFVEEGRRRPPAGGLVWVSDEVTRKDWEDARFVYWGDWEGTSGEAVEEALRGLKSEGDLPKAGFAPLEKRDVGGFYSLIPFEASVDLFNFVARLEMEGWKDLTGEERSKLLRGMGRLMRFKGELRPEHVQALHEFDEKLKPFYEELSIKEVEALDWREMGEYIGEMRTVGIAA